jgi:hypothetical protein
MMTGRTDTSTLSHSVRSRREDSRVAVSVSKAPLSIG